MKRTLTILTIIASLILLAGSTFAAAEKIEDRDMVGDWKLVEEISGGKSLKYKASSDRRFKMELDKKMTMTTDGEVIRGGYFYVKGNTLYFHKKRGESGSPMFTIKKAGFLAMELEKDGTVFKFKNDTWRVKLPGVWKVIGIRKKGKFYKMKKDAQERLFYFGKKAFKWTEDGKPVRSGFYSKISSSVFYKKSEAEKGLGIPYLKIRHYFSDIMAIRLEGASIDFVLKKLKLKKKAPVKTKN